MKKIKNSILLILGILSCMCFTFGLTACSNDNDSNSNANQANENIVEIYNMYVAHAEENDTTPLSYEDWLISIKGEKGDKGNDGTNGTNGTNGKSAYEIWLENGNTGTETDFLNWLKGKDGTNGSNGNNGTNGSNGKSAYEIWLENGNTGTETDFLNWLKGKDGTNGVNGLGIKSVNVNEDGDLIITFDNDTILNAGNVVYKPNTIDDNNKITFNTLTVTDNTVYGKVSNNTTVYSFNEEINLIGNAGFSVYTDIQGVNEIPTKTVNLEIGDNTFYILETVENDNNLYTVTVRRKPIYTVSFTTDSEYSTYLQDLETQFVEEDAFIAEPIYKHGYGAVLDYDIDNPITKDTTITATSWNAIFNYGKGYGVSYYSIGSLTEYGANLSTIYVPKEIDGNTISLLQATSFSYNNTSIRNKNIILEDNEWILLSGVFHYAKDRNITITYKGTVSRWEQIAISGLFYDGTDAVPVTCIDGVWEYTTE